jgi:Protein of unknown function (DUF3253)
MPGLTEAETAIEAEILRQAAACGVDKSLCPSDVAMAMGTDWRSKLSAVRRAAIRLACAGRIDILRKGRPVDPVGVKGVIRLRLRPPSADSSAT